MMSIAQARKEVGVRQRSTLGWERFGRLMVAWLPALLFPAALLLPIAATAVAASTAARLAQPQGAPVKLPTLGQLVREDPRFDALVAPDATIEVLGSGFEWSEGPIWIKNGGYLLFSDIPRNAIMKWKEGEQISPFIKPA